MSANQVTFPTNVLPSTLPVLSNVAQGSPNHITDHALDRAAIIRIVGVLESAGVITRSQAGAISGTILDLSKVASLNTAGVLPQEIVPGDGFYSPFTDIVPKADGTKDFIHNDSKFAVYMQQQGYVTQKRMAVCLLDSITAGYAGVTAAQAWPSVFASLTMNVYGKVVNKAISGNTTQNGLARMSDIVSAYDFTTYTGVDVYYLGGVNNFGNESQDLSTVTGQLATSFTQLKAPNPAKVRVFAITLPAAIWNSNPATVTSKINDLNAYIRTNATGALGANGFIDLARQPEFQDPNNTAWYVDKIHPTVNGAGLMGQVMGAYALTGSQPTGPILSNTTTPTTTSGDSPPSGFTGWVAPASGDSTEYDAEASSNQGYSRVGAWADFDNTHYWADNKGVHGDNTGDTITSPQIFARSVRVLTACVPGYGGIARLDLIRVSDGVTVATQTVNQGNGTDGIAPTITLTAPALGVYQFRETNTGGGEVYLSGLIITRSAS